MKLMSAVRFDLKLQLRHGFYAAYAFVCVFYVGLLYALPEVWREAAGVFITFSDPSALGFYFIGGLLLLERGQGVHDCLFVTPHDADTYIASKTLSLTALATASACLIHASVFGLSAAALAAVAVGTALTSVFFTLLGIGAAVLSRSVNGFFLISVPFTVPFMLPIAGFVDPDVLGPFAAAGESLWMKLLPTRGSLTLLSSAYRPADGGDIAAACLTLIIWSAAAYLWTRRLFIRRVIARIGEGERS